MALLPLIDGFDPERPLLRHRERWVSHGEFMARAQQLAQQLPDAAYAINLCADRYRFMLAFAAAGLRGQTSLLPSSPAPAAVAGIREQYPHSQVIGDAEIDVDGAVAAYGGQHSPQVEADAVAAVLFTSGSTGVPQAHAKSWNTLRVIARHLSQRLYDEAPGQIVATVPSQHMYGLETTVLMALGAGCTVHSARPLFPQDVVQALHEVPAPRALVTTPVHLRALIASAVQLPPLRFILSATAPLSLELARACETTWGAPVLEIYGCTEAGSTATRRTLDGDRWRMLPGMSLQPHDGAATVHAAHLAEPVLLQDQLELESGEYFRMVGRNTDLLKVAGKRASLADLTHKLLAIPGVIDAVIFNAAEGEAARPAALVVAPSLHESAILQALAQQVDAAFLPRPLRKVASLPRNELGKLPRQRLLELLERPG